MVNDVVRIEFRLRLLLFDFREAGDNDVTDDAAVVVEEEDGPSERVEGTKALGMRGGGEN